MSGFTRKVGCSPNLVRDSIALADADADGCGQSCGHFNPVEKLPFRRPPSPSALRSAPLPSLSTKIYAPSSILLPSSLESIHYTGLKRECPPSRHSIRPSVRPSVRTPEQSHQRLSNITRAKMVFLFFPFGFTTPHNGLKIIRYIG